MGTLCDEELRYAILDPTGNITALVESAVDVSRQPAVGAAIMRCHPEVEQVGFVRWPRSTDEALPELRMAGGEFCGNATMSAAALYLLDGGVASPSGVPTPVTMRVSGASRPLEVRLGTTSDDAFEAAVCMPAALGIERVDLSLEGLQGQVPVVRLEGIAHGVIGPDSVFASLRADRGAAERAVQSWCDVLAADGLGLMFVEDETANSLRMTPLVYIPGGDTVFWENSCASGSAAVGIYAAAQAGTAVDLTLREPGGQLRVKSDPASGETWLFGHVHLVARHASLARLDT